MITSNLMSPNSLIKAISKCLFFLPRETGVSFFFGNFYLTSYIENIKHILLALLHTFIGIFFMRYIHRFWTRFLNCFAADYKIFVVLYALRLWCHSLNNTSAQFSAQFVIIWTEFVQPENVNNSPLDLQSLKWLNCARIPILIAKLLTKTQMKAGRIF